MFCHIYNLLSNFLFTDQSQYVQYASRILVPHNMEKKRINDKAPNKNRQKFQENRQNYQQKQTKLPTTNIMGKKNNDGPDKKGQISQPTPVRVAEMIDYIAENRRHNI